MARHDPLRNFRYRQEINDIEQAGFAEVTVGDLSTGPIEYREGDEIFTVVGRKNSIGVVKLPIGTHDAARRGLVLI